MIQDTRSLTIFQMHRAHIQADKADTCPVETPKIVNLAAALDGASSPFRPRSAASGAHESVPDTEEGRAWAGSCPDIFLCASIKRWAKASATSDDDRNRPIHALCPMFTQMGLLREIPCSVGGLRNLLIIFLMHASV